MPLTSIKPSRPFARLGWAGVSVDLTDAVLGAEIEVETFSGPVTVTVPPGTQPDAVLRLTGKGLPRFGAKGDGGDRPKGDLFVTLRVHLPDRLGAEQRRLFKRLRALEKGGGGGT